MNEPRKSDSPIVPMKSPNKAGQPAAEEAEERGLAKGNLPSKTPPGLSAGKVRPVRWSGYVRQSGVITRGKSRMRQFRLSGSVEGVMGNHDSYSDPACGGDYRGGSRL